MQARPEKLEWTRRQRRIFEEAKEERQKKESEEALQRKFDQKEKDIDDPNEIRIYCAEAAAKGQNYFFWKQKINSSVLTYLEENYHIKFEKSKAWPCSCFSGGRYCYFIDWSPNEYDFDTSS